MTIREFTNELGNRIRITIEGPTSTSENVLTPIEVAELRRALNTDATEQSLGLYAAQAEAIRELLDQHAPHTTGNLQARIAQALGVTEASAAAMPEPLTDAEVFQLLEIHGISCDPGTAAAIAEIVERALGIGVTRGPAAGVMEAPAPVKRWPFVESPGEFTQRLAAAMREFPTLLAAVRCVLIENAPTLTNGVAPSRGPSRERIERMVENLHRALNEQNPTRVRLAKDALLALADGVGGPLKEQT